MSKLNTFLILLFYTTGFSCTPADVYSFKELQTTTAPEGKVITFVIEKNSQPFTEPGYLWVPGDSPQTDRPAIFLVHGGGNSSNMFASLTAADYPFSLYREYQSNNCLFAVLPSPTDPGVFEKILVKTIWPYLIKNYGMSKKEKHLSIGGVSGGSVLAALIAGKYRKQIGLFYLCVGAFNVDDFRAWVEKANPDLKDFPVFYQMSGTEDSMFDKQIELGEYIQGKGVKTYNQSVKGGHDLKVTVIGLRELYGIFQDMCGSPSVAD